MENSLEFKMRKISIVFGLVIGAILISGIMIGPDGRRLVQNLNTSPDVLFWSQAEREAGFRMLDKIPILVTTNDINSSAQVSQLPIAEPLPDDLQKNITQFMTKNNVASVVVLQNGKLRHEQYGLEFGPEGRWTSFSVAKSLTSTLVGAAIQDGYIKGLHDKVSDYVTGLKGSAYDEVSIEQLLTMSSGVQWNEDYSDPASDVALFNSQVGEDGESALVTYMKKLPRIHPPGTVWNYSSGETNMIGVLVREATGKSLSSYLSEKVWSNYPMEAKGTWLLSQDGEEISGCCIQARTRDFARFGQLVLNDGIVNGKRIVPTGWFDKATQSYFETGRVDKGYGFQWWINKDGSFEASGIFGQGIFIDPNRNLVIASNSNWTSALGDKDNEYASRTDFYKSVQQVMGKQ